MQSLKKYMLLAMTASLLFFLSSCSSKYTGWGVLYVGDAEQNLEEGKIFPVVQESEIRDVYTIENADSGETLDIPRWKLEFFEKENDALIFAESYSQWIDIYAETLLNGLSIREEADGESERVYKLREGQLVKIVGRANEMINIADHDGYWYLVLTEDGIKGYCFDKNLRIYNIKDSSASNTGGLDSELLQSFFDKDFRPEYYYDMIRDRMIDLRRFRREYGIFSYPEEKRIDLISQQLNLSFEYTDIFQNSSGRFIFEGTSLQVEVRSDNRIAVYYNHENREFAEVMVYIADIETIIEDELERRKLLYEEFQKLGTVSSSAYGRITFGEERNFIWKDKKRLVPNVIPEAAGDNGRISLDYFPGINLKETYDGVISFSFEGIPAGGLVNFLFELSDLGVKLVYVPAKDIDKGVIEKESTSPLVIFMSGAGE